MKRLYLLFLTITLAVVASAQTNSRDYVRRGNRHYRDSVFDKAQVEYQKGFQKDSNNVQVLYNLGNSLLVQGQPKEAMRLFEKAGKMEHNKSRRHMIYHNMGVILQSQKQFAQAIECYKEALRADCTDNETRYNLVLCQRQLKNDQNQQGGGEDDKNGDQNDKDKNKQDQQQKQKQQNQDQQKQDQKDKQQQQQPQQNQMSKENAEQMLNAAMQKERNTQDKVNQQQQKPQQRRLQKQW